MRARFDLYDDPMASLAELERYAAQTSSALIELAARILSDGTRSGRRRSRRAMPASPMPSPACCARCRSMPRARQLYVPADMLERHGAQAEDVFAGKATTELRAALAELRLRARQHLDAARAI